MGLQRVGHNWASFNFTIFLGLLLCFRVWGTFFGGIQHSPIDGCSAVRFNFGVLTREDDHTSFYSTILNNMEPTRDFWSKVLEQVITMCSSHSYTWQQVSPWGEEYNQSDFNIDHLVMSMCRVISCIVDRGCLLWPVCSLGKTLLLSSLFHFVLQGKLACYSRYFLTTGFCTPVPYDEKYIFFWY